jgi:hypothetical protein
VRHTACSSSSSSSNNNKPQFLQPLARRSDLCCWWYSKDHHADFNLREIPFQMIFCLVTDEFQGALNSLFCFWGRTDQERIL